MTEETNCLLMSTDPAKPSAPTWSDSPLTLESES